MRAVFAPGFADEEDPILLKVIFLFRLRFKLPRPIAAYLAQNHHFMGRDIRLHLCIAANGDPAAS
jgi:hypothetical protein